MQMTPDSHTIKSNTVYHMCCKQKYFKTGIYVLSYWASISIFTRYSSGMKTPFWTPEMSQNFISSINQSIKISTCFIAPSIQTTVLNHFCSRNSPAAAVYTV